MKFTKWVTISLTILAVVMLLGALVSFAGCGEEFKIKDGVLTSYNGDSEIVEIPSEVTKISSNAFIACGFVEEIIFPARLEEIENGALEKCPNAIWTISKSHPVFYTDNGNLMRREDKRLIMASKDGVAPSYAESIETGAYAALDEDIELTLPAGLTFLSKGAIKDCEVAALYIGNDVKTIEAQAFKDADIDRIYVTSIEVITSETFAKMSADLVSVDGLADCVEANAFYDSTIEEIVIGSSVTKIRNGAINNVKLEALTVPFLGARNGVAGEETRTDTTLGEIFGEEGSAWTHSICSYGTKIHKDLEKVTILGGMIGSDAFSACINVETIVLGDGVYGQVGAYAFKGVDSTLTLHVGKGITGFGEGAFWRSWITDSVLINYIGTEQEWNQLVNHSGDGKEDWTGKTNVTIRYCVPMP